MPGISPEQLARLGSLPIKARVIVEGALSGLHRASVHGSSVEFAEHKEYSPGDELRHVDWKAYAKLDRYYVKQYEQESQLTVYLVLDASASMKFAGGGLPKLEYAGLLLAGLAYLVIQQQDKVGFIACGDRSIEAVVPPRARASHLHDVLGVLDQVMQRGKAPPTQIAGAAALERIAELARRRRRCADRRPRRICSTRMTTWSSSGCAQLRAQRHDVSVVHVLDPHERTFPYDGLTEFHALESHDKLLVNPQAIRRDYLERMDAFLGDVRALRSRRPASTITWRARIGRSTRRCSSCSSRARPATSRARRGVAAETCGARRRDPQRYAVGPRASTAPSLSE